MNKIRAPSIPSSRSKMKMLNNSCTTINSWRASLVISHKLGFKLFTSALWGIHSLLSLSNLAKKKTKKNTTTNNYKNSCQNTWLSRGKTSFTVLLSSTESALSSQNIIRLVKHDLSLANPCWLFSITLFTFLCLEMASRKIYSIIFPGIEMILTCIQFPGCPS